MTNFGDGKLNSFGLPFCSTTYQNNSLVSSLRETALKRFNAEAFEQQGVLRAICLRTNLSVKPPAGSWVQSSGVADIDKMWLTVYARIPELHAHLVDPFAYGNSAGNAHLQINLHPAFISAAPVGQKEFSTIPAPGDIIEVDFGDRINMTQPTYRGRVSDGTIKVPSGGAFQHFSQTRQDQGLDASEANVTSDLSKNRTINGTTRPHNGVDYTASEGTRIYAMKNGVLTYHNQPGGAGFYIKINHLDGTWSKYFHLSKNDIHTQNKLVQKGDFIGLTGNTGASQAPHLHLELRGAPTKGEVLDPHPFADIVLGLKS